MNVTALDRSTPGALFAALTGRGVDAVRADAVVRGVRPVAFVLDGLDESTRERVVRAAQRRHLECLTGDGWAVLAGGAAEVAGVARPGHSLLPDELAAALGRSLAADWSEEREWVTARGTIRLDPGVVVGILNVTPDSFSDGGRFVAPADAASHAARLIDDGATVLDIGAESTAPGVDPVDAEEEWRRLQPVLAAVAADHPEIPVTVDTRKAETAERAIEAGAWAINDVSGLRHDPTLADAVARSGAGIVLMHSRGPAGAIADYDRAEYDDVATAVVRELASGCDVATAAGVAAEAIVLDPGLGFSKTPEHTVIALQAVGGVAALGYPVMIGPSRKRFLGALTGRAPGERDAATAAACAAGYALGARLFRVHAPAPTVDALAVARAVWGR